ncbi:hypothetical protein VNO77_08914 [Canavalia gladiata]|uniref:Uncharacterized protein n=1 Tax=Canavalia gladiata TaxID=3824 RepID=A0AAN9M8U1_CANGL
MQWDSLGSGWALVCIIKFHTKLNSGLRRGEASSTYGSAAYCLQTRARIFQVQGGIAVIGWRALLIRPEVD